MSLTNEQYDEIMRSYDRKQTARRHILENRKQELYQHVPALTELDRQIVHDRIGLARARLNHDKASETQLRSSLKKLHMKRSRAISRSGFPEDWLNPPYECPDCQDTGYIGGQPCHCFRQAAIDLVYTQSNLKDILNKENFSTFSLDYYSNEETDPETGLTARENAANVRKACERFVDHFDRQFENLLLFGNTGTGKTFLSHCIAKELLNDGHSVIYFSAQQFFDTLSEHVFRRNDDNRDFDNIRSCDLLIIDDLGTEFSNSLTISQFFACLNDRILNQRSTLISTNLNLSDISDVYSERISSRLTEQFTLLHLAGSDIRIQKKLEENGF